MNKSGLVYSVDMFFLCNSCSYYFIEGGSCLQGQTIQELQRTQVLALPAMDLWCKHPMSEPANTSGKERSVLVCAANIEGTLRDLALPQDL